MTFDARKPFVPTLRHCNDCGTLMTATPCPRCAKASLDRLGGYAPAASRGEPLPPPKKP